MVQWKQIWLGTMRLWVRYLASLSKWIRDPALLWLWRRPAATAPIRPLAWEPPCAAVAAPKRQKKKKKALWNEAEYRMKEVSLRGTIKRTLKKKKWNSLPKVIQPEHSGTWICLFERNNSILLALAYFLFCFVFFFCLFAISLGCSRGTWRYPG